METMNKITPTQVAEYANRDSLALGMVANSDLLEELRVRGTEANTLSRMYIIQKLKDLASELKKTYLRSV